MSKRRASDKDQQVDYDQTPPQLEAWMRMPNGARVRRCQRWWRSGPKAGKQCGKPAMKVGNCCKTHGGGNAAKIGPLNSNWKGGTSKAITGRYSSRLGDAERDVYLRALKDPQILSLEDEIALTDVRLGEMVSRANGEHNDPELVKQTWNDVKQALASGDRMAIRVAIEQHDSTVNGRADREKAWSQLDKLKERRRALVESERRRLVEQHMFMSREQAHAYGQAIVEIVTRHIQDRATLLAIMTDFRLVQSATSRPVLQAASVDGEVLGADEDDEH